MHNLQLIDSLDGGYFLFKRNDYPIDEGIYSELYACLFSTVSADWWGDEAFDVESENIASRTGNALKNHNSNSDNDIALIKKAVTDDLKRFTDKNDKIEVESASVVVYSNNAIMIMIELTGNTDSFNFIYSKTKESLDNIKYVMYDI